MYPSLNSPPPGSLVDTTARLSPDRPGLVRQSSVKMPQVHDSSAVPTFPNHSSKNDKILAQLRGSRPWVINSRRRNGLILHKRYYTEFAGPGAAVGGGFDADCLDVIPLGNLSLLKPDTLEEQQKALRIRLQWVRLTQNFTDKPIALDRAQMILEQFKSYFDQDIVDQVPDEAFAMLVGVFPQTIRRARLIV